MMNHNPLNLTIGQLVLSDNKHEVIIEKFSPQMLFASVYEKDDPSKRVWTILTSRLTPKS